MQISNLIARWLRMWRVWYVDNPTRKSAHRTYHRTQVVCLLKTKVFLMCPEKCAKRRCCSALEFYEWKLVIITNWLIIFCLLPDNEWHLIFLIFIVRLTGKCEFLLSLLAEDLKGLVGRLVLFHLEEAEFSVQVSLSSRMHCISGRTYHKI
jgi:hypothetical protein